MCLSNSSLSSLKETNILLWYLPIRVFISLLHMHGSKMIYSTVVHVFKLYINSVIHLNIMFLRFIYVGTCSSNSFVFSAIVYSIK